MHAHIKHEKIFPNGVVANPPDAALTAAWARGPHTSTNTYIAPSNVAYKGECET